jgi:hypothetical protein
MKIRQRNFPPVSGVVALSFFSAAAASKAKELAGLNRTAANHRPQAVPAGYFPKVNSSCSTCIFNKFSGKD